MRTKRIEFPISNENKNIFISVTEDGCVMLTVSEKNDNIDKRIIVKIKGEVFIDGVDEILKNL